MVVLLLNDTQYARPKHGSTQGRNRAARSIYANWCYPHGNGLWYMYYLYQSEKQQLFVYTFILQTDASLPFYTDLGLPCTFIKNKIIKYATQYNI